jgi:RNA polymerase primary sigma factor
MPRRWKKNQIKNTGYLAQEAGAYEDIPLRDVEEVQAEKGPGRVSRESGHSEPKASENLIWAYLKEVSTIPLLSMQEERALAEEIQKGQKTLVRRLLQLDLEMDELDILGKKKQNVSEGHIADIMGTLEKLEGEKTIPPEEIPSLSEIKNLYGRLTRLKGEMLRRNLRLVIKIAKGYLYSGMSLSDLIQEGNLGLMRAVTKFDYKKGYKFSTYATWWVRQSIQRAIVEKGRTIRIPVHLMDTRRRLTKTYNRLLRDRGKSPRPEEIAKRAGVSPEVVKTALFSLPQTISLETPAGEDANLGQLIEDDQSPSPVEVVERREIRDMMEKVLSDLPPRQAEILRLRFGIDGEGEETLEEIGKKFGISRERVRQLEEKGIHRLRHEKQKFSAEVKSVL